ncbi:MAG: hypothetical protein K6T73_11500, partial [Candidatus Bathyarchaeota archaeon]|nr:hypothetical protein [Candidatus Bathyarchaeota archaeon]
MAEDYTSIYIAVGAFIGGVVVGLILAWMFGGCPSRGYHTITQASIEPNSVFKQVSKTYMQNT